MTELELKEFMKKLGYEISPYYINDEKENSICFIKYPTLHSLDVIEFLFSVGEENKVSLEYYSLSDVCIRDRKDLDCVNAEYAIMEWDLVLITKALNC